MESEDQMTFQPGEKEREVLRYCGMSQYSTARIDQNLRCTISSVMNGDRGLPATAGHGLRGRPAEWHGDRDAGVRIGIEFFLSAYILAMPTEIAPFFDFHSTRSNFADPILSHSGGFGAAGPGARPREAREPRPGGRAGCRPPRGARRVAVQCHPHARPISPAWLC
jgi:hypothetical protein